MRLQPPGLNPKMEVLIELNPVNIPSATEFQKRPKIQFQVSKYLRKEREKCSLYLLFFNTRRKVHLQEKCRMSISFVDLHLRKALHMLPLQPRNCTQALRGHLCDFLRLGHNNLLCRNIDIFIHGQVISNG